MVDWFGLKVLAWRLSITMGTAFCSEAVKEALTSLRERLIKTGSRLVRHARYAVFQMAEAALPQGIFAGILALINGMRGPPSGAASA